MFRNKDLRKNDAYFTEVESRTQGSRPRPQKNPRPRTQRASVLQKKVFAQKPCEISSVLKKKKKKKKRSSRKASQILREISGEKKVMTSARF